MNKFVVLPCTSMEHDKTTDYKGAAVALGCASDMSLVLFFPVSNENASLINYVLEDKKEVDINTDILGVYQTMLDSWSAGESFLSGIIMDIGFDEEAQETVLTAKITLSSLRTGRLEGFVKVNFVHAVLLSVMEKLEIIVVDEILDKLIPHRNDDGEEMDEDGDEDEADSFPSPKENTTAKNSGKPGNTGKINKKDPQYPVDKDILEIARKIMGGKIK